MKHIDAKYLWLQQKVKSGDLEMDGVATVLNVAEAGLGLVEYDPSTKAYVPTGGPELNLQWCRSVLNATFEPFAQSSDHSLPDVSYEVMVRSYTYIELFMEFL
eukprot:s3453_g11.t1